MAQHPCLTPLKKASPRFDRTRQVCLTASCGMVLVRGVAAEPGRGIFGEGPCVHRHTAGGVHRDVAPLFDAFCGDISPETCR